MIVVRIDRNTLRRNPDAGRTSTVMPTGVQSGTFTIERDGRTYDLDIVSVPALWADGGVAGKFYCRGVSGPPPHAFPFGETTEGKIGGTDKIVSLPEFSQEVVTIEHLPAPPWLYDYLPTNVTCDSCGESFDHSELRSDESFDGEEEFYSDRICPRCGEWDCCEVKYESPQEAAASTVALMQ